MRKSHINLFLCQLHIDVLVYSHKKNTVKSFPQTIKPVSADEQTSIVRIASSHTFIFILIFIIFNHHGIFCSPYTVLDFLVRTLVNFPHQRHQQSFRSSSVDSLHCSKLRPPLLYAYHLLITD